MSEADEYVLGTHIQEVERLGLQHRVWRGRTLDAWRRAGFRTGQRLLDVGCGPGYATLDLAEIAGPGGEVIGLDQSRRFLDVLEARRRRAGLGAITTHELDLDRDPLPALAVDGAWARWLFAFLTDPRTLLEKVARTLRPGAPLVLFEYLHYATWRLTPACPELDEYVRAVTASWRASGGEPDIALALPGWLEELGFEIRSLTPITDVVRPDSMVWEWPASFLHSGMARQVALGAIAPARAEEILAGFDRCARAPHVRMVTPTVAEIIAVKR